MEVPVMVGDIVEGEIVDISHEGGGIVKVNNFTIFLDRGLIGDIVKFEVAKLKKSYGMGKVLDIIKSSNYRIKPKCNVSNRCGGCQFQSFDYKAQLEWKKKKVKNDLIKIAGLEDIKINDTIGMDSPYRYRNNVQIPVAISKGKSLIGFYERGSYKIVETDTCILQGETGDRIIRILKEFINKYNITAIRHLGIRTNKDNEVMVILVTQSRQLPHNDDLINMIIKKCPNVVSIYQNINRRKGPVVYGDKFIKLYGKEKIIDYIGDLKFNISPNSFFQVNSIQTEVLYKKAIEFLGLSGDETVFDLYCGIGSISLFLSKQAKKVYGIEVVKEAILDARENAKLNKIDNVEFIHGTSEEVFPKLVEKGIKADKLVLDPPRKGCDQKVLDTIIEIEPQSVVYVSCNPSTLARDVGYLVEKGYKVEEVQPVDMFPWTGHVECIALIQKEIVLI
ncbi:23S rRNA (uracil(1939)-C(5))-methyltransferase RlmD [Anaerosalibacter sp. Marseille-P3206]|uniref:23S rRNA (uracil(1939)-C(5))-methyltransferase RlmD n=1 Tax=Anaerosalibacter sp. Marseille-P3206 TaxID=1871005 RepID=UPI000986ED8F|nr:23S rRNA (uracil(1939)-C(5))-methyltransferase RlmD [Anaerosalibacter sp. Marseille-P3206]